MRTHRRLTIALVIAFVLSGGFTWLLSRRIERQAALQRTQTMLYVAPARAVEAGEVLKPADVRLLAWPASSPVAGGFLKVEDVVGRASLYPLDPGQPIVDRQLTAAASGPGLASKIPNGMRAIALRSDEVVGVAGFLTPGSHLDVLVTYRSAQSADPITATVLENAEVVAAGNQLQPDPAGKAFSATVVTLLLTPREAQRAVLASTQGSIHFVLRNSTDTATVDSPPITLSQLTGGAASAPAPLPSHKTAAAPQPGLDAFLRRSKGSMLPSPAAVPFQIETVLGDSAGGGKSSERAQP